MSLLWSRAAIHCSVASCKLVLEIIFIVVCECFANKISHARWSLLVTAYVCCFWLLGQIPMIVVISSLSGFLSAKIIVVGAGATPLWFYYIHPSCCSLSIWLWSFCHWLWSYLLEFHLGWHHWHSWSAALRFNQSVGFHALPSPHEFHGTGSTRKRGWEASTMAPHVVHLGFWHRSQRYLPSGRRRRAKSTGPWWIQKPPSWLLSGYSSCSGL